MHELSLMILCGASPRHVYIANRLSRRARVVAIVQERGRELSARKIARALEPAHALRKLSRWLRDRQRYAGGAEADFFFGGATPALTRADLLTVVSNINDPAVDELARRLEPDVIAVFGTSLIRAPLLGRGRLGMFNLHGGLSPHYRGADCTFWALYNSEPHRVGCTLHRIDAGIDTGNLVAHVCPAVKPGDDELTLFWRAVRDSGAVYAELLERLARGETPGLRQAGKGTLYQVRQRSWHHERQLRARLRAGMLDAVNLPPRVQWFFDDTAAASGRAVGT
jgi:methionyl-tRNA formyltransferase